MDIQSVIDDIGRSRSALPVDLTWLQGKRVLVSGAGGSIGGELCKQLAANGIFPYMLDRDDNGLCQTLYAIDPSCDLTRPEMQLVDIRDLPALRKAFDQIMPHVVFHAAAQNDVVLCQSFPVEAIKTNIHGTYNMLKCSASAHVQLFLNISTDKAAEPANVMGATKRVAERLVAFQTSEVGRYISVRFGNVLGSQASVIEVFRQQISQGGPVTLTHAEVERYFMTLSEAVSLVLTAAATGRTGETVVLDMGPSIKILDVIKHLMAVAQANVPIQITGLRPGEKLAEVLFGNDEAPYRFSEHASAVSVPPIDYTDFEFWDDWALSFKP